MIDDIMKVKAIKAFLNMRYSNALGWSLDASNFLVDQDTFKFLRQALRYEVGMSLDTPDSNPTFKNKLDNVGEKLNNGWTSNIVTLLKITLVLKNIAPNLDYESSVYGESFGLALYQFQTDAGILDSVGDDKFKSYEIIALFSDYGFKPVLATDAKARELGQFLNSYVIKHGIASIVGLTRTDGLVYNFGDYSPLIVAQLQRENQLTVTGKLTVCPTYNDELNSTTYPTAEALYLHGYLDNIPQDYFDIVDYRAAIEHYQTKCGYPKNNTQLTTGEMQTLFNSNQLGTINGLKAKQAIQHMFDDLFDQTNIDFEWNQEYDLGSETIMAGSTAFTFDASVEVDIDDKTTHKNGFTNDHQSFTANITNGKFTGIDDMTTFDKATADVLLKPLEGPILKSKITNGTATVTLETDPQFMNTFSLTYAVQLVKMDDKPLSTTLTIKVKLSGSFNQFTQLLSNNANQQAQLAYNALANGDFGTYQAEESNLGIDSETQTLNLKIFTNLLTMSQTNSQVKWKNPNIEFNGIQLLNQEDYDTNVILEGIIASLKGSIILTGSYAILVMGGYAAGEVAASIKSLGEAFYVYIGKMPSILALSN